MLYGQNLPWRIALRNTTISATRQSARTSGILSSGRAIRQHHELASRSPTALRRDWPHRSLGAPASFSTTTARRKDAPPKDPEDKGVEETTEEEAKKEKEVREKNEEKPGKGKVTETSSSGGNSSPDVKGSAAGGAGDSGDGGEKKRPARKSQIATAVEKADKKISTPPEIFPQVMAIPITTRPLYPGFYKAITIKNPFVIAAIQDLMKTNQPYIGTFLYKDSTKDGDVIEDIDDIHEVGTFAQITSALPMNQDAEALTVVLYPHRRIRVTSLVHTKSTCTTVPKKTGELEPVVPEIIPQKNEAASEKKGDVVASFEETSVAEKDASNVPVRHEPTSFLRKYPVSLVDIENLQDLPYSPSSPVVRAITNEIVNVFKDIARVNPMFRDQISTFSMSQSAGNVLFEPGKLADFAAAVSVGEVKELQEVLEALDIEDRLEKGLHVLKKELMNAQLQNKIKEGVEERIQRRQREYYLIEQIKSIRKELGTESDTKEKMIDAFREKAFKLDMPEQVKKAFDEELNKFMTLEPTGSEFNITRTYLDWLTTLPWGKSSVENFGVDHAKGILDEDHYGLSDVKDRILEFIAVGKLRGSVEGKIICFAGPPGTGKTSIGKSIARALNREYYRFSVGGMTDVSEIKGHRRTYIGALPGRMILALKKCQTENPLILIDEVDKISKSYQGDPAAALLEVLDPEQNHAFLDQYMDVPVDLSKVLFVCTANWLNTIPGPLRDRMEVIELSGYVADEKQAIAERYLVPAAKKLAGLEHADVNLTKDALAELIKAYCRESGVRNLKQKIEKIYRKAALKIVRDLGEEALPEAEALTEEGKEALKESKKDQTGVGETSTNIEKETAIKPRKPLQVPDSVHITIDKDNLQDYVGQPIYTKDRLYETTPAGVIMGLAVTQMGGEALYIETILESALTASSQPSLGTTGNLAQVMKESSTIAYSFAKSVLAKAYPENRFFDKAKLHLHCPQGAVPKDGPSAGIAMATSLLSLALDQPIDPTIAMTGELTVTGKVLGIGGLREKTVAAKRAGCKKIVFPKDNMSAWAELPENIKADIEGVPADWYSDVFDLVFPNLDATRVNNLWKEQLAKKDKDKDKKDRDEDDD